jgi:hypothetical protein
MITLNEELGFDNQIANEIKTEFNGLDIQFKHCDKATCPLESFVYVLIDTQKLENVWKKDTVNYIPQDLSELLESDFNPVHAYTKSQNKISMAKQHLENDQSIWSPVIMAYGNDMVAFDDGRHRFCLIRELGLPFFTAAVAIKLLVALDEADVLYHSARSTVFDDF